MRFDIEIPADKDGTYSLGFYEGANLIAGLHLTSSELYALKYVINGAQEKYRNAHLNGIREAAG